MANRENTEPNNQESATASASSQARARGRRHGHLLTFAVTVLVVWGVGTCLYTYFFPLLTYKKLEIRIVQHGISASNSGIPINTLYTMPTLASPS
jgi:hypothetical protein